MERKQKETVVRELQESLGKACGTFLVDYQGLNVETLTKLRRQLREANVEFQVVKNRLLSRAVQGTETAVLKDYFTGPSALAITYDEIVGPAKLLTRFSQENEALEIKVGQINGTIIDLPGIKRLAELPSKEILIAQLLSCLSGVPTSFVRILSEIPRSLITVLDAIRNQRA